MEVIVQTRASRGIVKDYNLVKQNFNAQTTIEHLSNMTALDMYEVDPALSAAIDLTVDLATYKGYDFRGKNEKEIKKARKLFNDTLDFDSVIDNILYSFLIYGNAYLEIVFNKSGTEVKELHPLETTEMEVVFDEHGEILNYIQKPAGSGKDNWVIFDKDSIVYFRLKLIGSEVKSRVPFKPIARDFTTNVLSNNYLQKIFLNLPPKVIYFLKTASERHRKEFIENLIRSKTNPNIDIVMQGEAGDSKLIQPNFDTGLMSVLGWIQKRVLMITRVPPHWVGMLDGANRGIGENVVIPYETRIKKIQQKIASQINRELMEKLKLENVEFIWNAISLLDEKELIANMGQLSTQGFDSETIIDYARDRGLNLNENAHIIAPPSPSGPQIQDDSAPSRQREGKSDKMNDEINKKGVSDAGKAKLKKNQDEKR